MADNLHGTFVSQKISKVRWKPERLDDSEYFVTGSTDELVNKVCIWVYPVSDVDPDNYPRVEKSVQVNGDVTEIQFINPEIFVVSTSEGAVRAYQGSYLDLKEIHAWEDIHVFKTGDSAPCTSIACFEEDIASVGEDGSIVLLTLNERKPMRKLEQVDSCSLKCVTFLKHNELLTGNLRGQLKIWDLRSAQDKPLSTFMLSNDMISATCVAHHPTQSHILLAGGEDGSLTAWDLRTSTYPINVLNAHDNAVNEILFHKERPEHLFTCSFGGDLWQWNTQKGFSGDDTSWLMAGNKSNKMEVLSLMSPIYKSINSIDVHRARLISGCDNEAIYIIKNLTL